MPRKRFASTVVRALALALLLQSAASAQLSMSPLIAETRVYPGGLKTFRVSVSNRGKTPLDCEISRHGMRIEGGGMPVMVDDAPRSCKEWLTVTPEKFTLRPGQGQVLICRARATPEASGGYYGIVSCLGVPQEGREGPGDEGTRAAVRFSYRVMCIIMLTVPRGKVEALVEAAEPSVETTEGASGYSFVLPIRNVGNIHTRMTGAVAIRSAAGQKIEEFNLMAGRGFLLPDHERLFRSRGKINLPDGLYRARVELVPIAGGAPMRKEFPFYLRDGTATVAELTAEEETSLLEQSAGFTVTPAELSEVVYPGARRSVGIEVVNLLKEPLTLHLRALEWYRTAAGIDLVAPRKAPHGRSARPMLTLPQQTLVLRPMARRRLPVAIRMPKDAQGEAYAAVAFDRAGAALDTSPVAVARRSALLRITAQGEGRAAAEIDSFTAERRPNGAVRFTLNVRNTGQLGILPDVSIDVVDATAAIVARLTPPPRTNFVQAGTGCTLTADLAQVLDPGPYVARLSCRYSQDLPPLTGRIEFEVGNPLGDVTAQAAHPHPQLQ
jgi:P pilus assembly chaperone PapD